MLKRFSLHAIPILKQTLRCVLQVQRAHRYFPQTLDSVVASRTAALAYWQGQYLAIDRDEDIAKMAEVSVPSLRPGR